MTNLTTATTTTNRTPASEYIPRQYQPTSGYPALHTTRDAAEYLGTSPAAIRRALHRHSVRVGRTVSGQVRLSLGSRTGYLAVTAS